MNNNFESGQISRTLIILAIVVLCAVVLVYGLLRYTATRQVKNTKTEAELAAEQGPPKPVYDVTLGDVRFLFDSAFDLGSVIKAQSSYQQDLVTTEKFIYVTVRAQNKGKMDTAPYAWSLGNLVDADGRNFIEYSGAYAFLPRPNLCSVTLKPEFEPTPCVKIYEVSSVSTNLKIQVSATSGKSSKKQEALLDLKIR